MKQTLKTIEVPVNNSPDQEAIYNSPARFTVVVKGRRWGLTKGIANNFIKEALQGPAKKFLWVDTIAGNIDKYIERYFVTALQNLPKELWNWRKQASILEIRGAYIDFRSADNPYSIEGQGYERIFLNEAGISLRNEYLWENAIRPMLWDNPNSKLILGGTPKGRGLFYQLALRGQDPEQADWSYFHFDSFDSPYVDKVQLQKDIESMNEMAVRQEIRAEFVDEQGLVFRGITEVLTAKPSPPQPGKNYVIGADIAKHEDFTVLVVYDRGNNRQVYQDRFNELSWPFVQNKIAELSKHYNHAPIVLDSTGVGDVVFDNLSRAGVPVTPFKFTNTSKQELIEKLSTYIELKRIELLPLEETRREFSEFGYEFSDKTNRVFYGAPSGFHDDIVIAHALAIWDMFPLYGKASSLDNPTRLQTMKNQLYSKKERDYQDFEQDTFEEWSHDL